MSATLATPAQPFALSADERSAIQHERAHYENPRAASIEALKIVQKRRGWVSDEALKAIAPLLGMSPAELEEVATFYSLIFRRPVGRNVVKVCDSVSCYLTGYDELKSSLEKKLGIKYGQTTPDGRFTLLPICCLGACDKGPCLMVNDDLHGPLAADGLDSMLERYP